ncbi:Fc.00g049940.m01.CDS01 [Cosmosporella sp. VM-42]
MVSYNSTECGDGLFGPSVWAEGCRGGFDFTLSFEESILSILPSAFFLLLVGPRSFYLFNALDKTKRHSTYTPKLITSAIYAILQVVLAALVPTVKQLNTRFSIAAAVLNLLAAFSIVILAHAEHVKSIRPSFLLTAYLFVSLLFDAARLRTEWLISVNTAYAAVLSSSATFKLALLALETVEKRKVLINKEKVPSRESTSGPFSRGFFIWLNSLLMSGWATVLTKNDLPAIYEKLSSEKLAVRFGKTWGNALRSKKPSLFIATVKVLKWELLSIALPRIAMIGLTISQPSLISSALRFLSMPDGESTMNLGYGLIGAFAFVFIGSAIITAWYEHLTFRAAAMVRGGLITLIYGKMMKLPTNELNESSAVALMGNDVETLAERLNALLVESWANTITVGIAMWMLADQLGPVCVAPIITAFISLALSGGCGKLMVPRQIVYQKATQHRINFTSETLGSIKAVKMLGFTERFSNLITQKRDTEIEVGKDFRKVSVYSNAITNCNISFTQAITFGAYAIVAKLSGGEPFSAAQGITALAILGVMMNPLSFLLGNIPHSFSAIGCFQRIQDFLVLDERIDSRNVRSDRPSSLSKGLTPTVRKSVELKDLKSVSMENSSVAIRDGNFNWGDKSVLKDITASFPKQKSGSLTMVVGPIGSGKSSLLKAILGEITSANGVVSLNSPDIAFCDQTPWVMNATIQANIIAESKGFDACWFDTVVEACDLNIDLARLPEGDQTEVGDKGVKLSGGQKQRLAIARAIYSRKPVAIFDDVFSGLDKVTEQAVFDQVFGNDGLLRKNGTTAILATHAVHRLPESDFIIALGQGGRIVDQGVWNDLRSRGGYIESLDISGSLHDEGDEPAEEKVPVSKAKSNKLAPGIEADDEPPSDTSVFKYYFQAIRIYNLGIQVILVASSAAINMFRYVWLTWWGDGKGHSSGDVGYWLSIYSVLSVLEGVLVSVAIAHFLLVIGPTSGRTLHKRLLGAAMSAPMSFLSNTDTGSLINRFSQDMRLVDVVLPMALSVFIFEVSQCFGVAGLAIAAVGWFAIAIPFVILVLVLIQRFYVRTSKQLRILEIEHKAPLYSHFLESIHGLATIRAFGWVRPYTDKNLILLDTAQKPSYLLNCIQRWLTLVLDLVVAMLTIILVALAVTLREKMNPSLLGVALVNMMELGNNMKGIILYWSILETSLGAITRIRTFTEKTPTELNPAEDRLPSEEWPTSGHLEFKNLAVQYDTTAEPILRGVSFSIRHGEKIGLCGRSGSGKSSLIQALLRLANTVDGQIILDGEDIAKIPRSLLRQKLSCLTQDPFLFIDTIRFNVDPLAEHSDEAILAALERVGIWPVIRAKVEEGKDPLDERMDENFLSHGQRQLFCLARALLKKSSVLILDEPTSSVDSQTDVKIQEVIRSEFLDRTIVMIAHRLDTLLDFDKIAVLDAGSLVEFGSPGELLADDKGTFARLYRADKSRKGKGRDA